MQLSDFWKSMRRRWYVLLVGLLATVGICYGAIGAVPASYTARGLVLLLPSEETVGEGGNPFLAMDGLGLPASILVAYFASASAQAEVTESFPDATYSVALEESTRGPLIAIVATDTSSAGALGALAHLADAIPANLARLQGAVGAPPGSTVTSMPLTMDAETVKDNSAGTRLVIAAAAAGVAGTVLLTALLDGLLMRRRRRPQ